MQPNKDQPKSLSRCDEIMLRDEITGLDGMLLFQKFNRLCCPNYNCTENYDTYDIDKKGKTM